MHAEFSGDILTEARRALIALSRTGLKGVSPSARSLEILAQWGNGQMVSPTTETLADIRSDLGECTRCKLSTARKNLVFGAGSPSARLVFVGEAPGFDEDRLGQPFVGAAGQLLTRIIQAMGLRREDVYICNILKCRPPGNRNPQPEEIARCVPFLERQIAAIAPECICALGSFAAQTLLETPTPISRLRGRFSDYRGTRLMPTYHPAYLLRNPEQKRAVWEDVQEIMKLMGLPATGASG